MNREATSMWRDAFKRAKAGENARETNLSPCSARASVRIVLQDRHSFLYFKSASEWTANPMEAYNFRQLLIAMDFVRTGRLQNLDVLLCFENPQYELRFFASV